MYVIHGDINQDQRDRTIKKFKNGNIKMLLATDVAARGIDVANLDLVINYDIPQENEYYVHRIGRTGRNNNVGKAITYVVGKEKVKLNEIEEFARTKIKFENIPTVTEINKIKDKELINRIEELIKQKNYTKSEVFENYIKSSVQSKDDIARALFSIICNRETIEGVDNDQNGDELVSLFLSVGKKDKRMAKDIIGSLSANTAINKQEIGKINILENYSFIEIPSKYLDEIFSRMNGNTIKGKRVNIEIAKA